MKKKKKIVEEYIRLYYESGGIEDELYSITTYNEKGKVQKKTMMLGEEGAMSESLEHSYNDNDQIIESIKIDYDLLSHEAYQTERTTYNYEGKLLKEKVIYYGDDFTKIIYFYDQEDALIKMEQADNWGVFQGAIRYEKDVEGLVKEIHEDANKDLIYWKQSDLKGRVLKEYDARDQSTTIYDYQSGNKVRNVKIFEDNIVTLDESYEYDKNENEIRSEGFDSETNDKIIIEKQYDDEGKLIKVEEFLNGQLERHQIIEYNENGDIQQEEKWVKDLEHGKEEIEWMVYKYEYF